MWQRREEKRCEWKIRIYKRQKWWEVRILAAARVCGYFYISFPLFFSQLALPVDVDMSVVAGCWVVHWEWWWKLKFVESPDSGLYMAHINLQTQSYSSAQRMSSGEKWKNMIVSRKETERRKRAKDMAKKNIYLCRWFWMILSYLFNHD